MNNLKCFNICDILVGDLQTKSYVRYLFTNMKTEPLKHEVLSLLERPRQTTIGINLKTEKWY